MITGIDPVEWKRLLGRANSGELSLHPEVGKGLDTVCDDQITRLQNTLRDVRKISQVTGFGTFDSSRILEKKFSETAAGGDRSLETVIKQHIEAIQTLKEVVAKAIANFNEWDTTQAAEMSRWVP